MLEFEVIKTNIGDIVRRAKVPGGWLVTVTSDVMHLTSQDVIIDSRDWRTSCTFVPDQYHLWEV